jgi:hypothetical protein
MTYSPVEQEPCLYVEPPPPQVRAATPRLGGISQLGGAVSAAALYSGENGAEESGVKQPR